MRRPEYEERRRRQVRMPMLILGGVMILFYLIMGGVLLAKPDWFPGVAIEILRIFGAMLLIYGGYRAWRLYSEYF